MNSNVRIVVIGAVSSTKKIIEVLFRNKMNVVGIFGLDPMVSKNVSGFVDLKVIAENERVSFQYFKQINADSIISALNVLAPEIIFGVGFSQLIGNEILKIPKFGVIGFHPTLLPKGRGRAPLAWLILKEKVGAASFFLMGEGADDGPVLGQSRFNITDWDNTSSLEEKLLVHIEEALMQLLSDIKLGIWDPKPQNEMEASYFGVRYPNDGLINWNNSKESISRLIRATSHPYPKAFTFFEDKKITINEVHCYDGPQFIGVPGRVLRIDRENGFLVMCINGALWIKGVSEKLEIKVGQKFGYSCEMEIYKLRQEILSLKKILLQ